MTRKETINKTVKHLTECNVLGVTWAVNVGGAFGADSARTPRPGPGPRAEGHERCPDVQGQRLVGRLHSASDLLPRRPEACISDPNSPSRDLHWFITA